MTIISAGPEASDSHLFGAASGARAGFAANAVGSTADACTALVHGGFEEAHTFCSAGLSALRGVRTTEGANLLARQCQCIGTEVARTIASSQVQGCRHSQDVRRDMAPMIRCKCLHGWTDTCALNLRLHPTAPSSPPPPPPTHPPTTTRFRQVCDPFLFVKCSCELTAESSERPTAGGVARRRWERRMRSWWRDRRQPPGPRRGEMHQQYDIPWRQNAPHPWEAAGPQRSRRSLRRSAGDSLPNPRPHWQGRQERFWAPPRCASLLPRRCGVGRRRRRRARSSRWRM